MTSIGLDDLVPAGTGSPAGTVDRAGLRSRIASVAAYVARRGGGDWLLYETDPFWFAAYLYGAALGGGNVTLLPDVRPGTLAALDRLYTGQLGAPLAGDRDIPRSVTTGGADGPVSLPSVPRGTVTVLTSGTTGDRKHLQRSLEQLLAESSTLQRTWALDEQIVVASMVSHHHMYGLAFGIVWPLSRGAQLLAAAQSPVPDFAAFDNHAGRRLCLIASPAYLHRVDASIALANFEDSRGDGVKLECVFSAGAPLDPGKAALAAGRLGCPINEIYGSSETGAVATRRADLDAPWRALPDVDLRVKDGCLLIDAPYIARSLTRPFTSADRVEAYAEGFRLLGRTDRVVKVEGKRVSLQQIEDSAESLDWVAECSAVLLDGERSQIAAAVVLSDAGLSLLREMGKPAIDRRLRRALIHDLEAVMVPRRIRYLTAIPATSEGKVDSDRLSALFNRDARRRPSLHAVARSQNGVQLDLALDPDLLAFEGHFPERAVLPGVALLHWVILLAHEYLDVPLRAGVLTKIKFMHILAPNDRLQLLLSRGDGFVDYCCLCAGSTSSKGRIRFAC